MKKLTENQNVRLNNEWSKIAGDKIEIEFSKGTFFVKTSEIGALRLFKAFKYSTNRDAYYSTNLGSWIFSLETEK